MESFLNAKHGHEIVLNRVQEEGAAAFGKRLKGAFCITHAKKKWDVKR